MWFGQYFRALYICPTFSERKVTDDPVAQLVEHNTFNVRVPGSSPGRITKKKEGDLSPFFFSHQPRWRNW
jgi:hypothetical protein